MFYRSPEEQGKQSRPLRQGLPLALLQRDRYCPSALNRTLSDINTNRWHPCACSQDRASRDCVMASCAATDRLLSEMTPASTSGKAGCLGTPRNGMVRGPPCPGIPLVNVFAMSLAPVKSSAITPRSIVLTSSRPLDKHPQDASKMRFSGDQVNRVNTPSGILKKTEASNSFSAGRLP